MSTLLNIAALSRRTGVAPDTLRKWESRYGVLRPERTPGGQRRYSERDVARVEWLRDRLEEGWRIGEAARVLEETAGPALDDPGDLRQALQEATTAHAGSDVGALLDQALAVLPLERALTEVVAPTLRWAGSEWHAGRLDVAQEHALTAKVRTRLDQLLADQRGAVRGTAVLACAPDEQHDLGLLMLAVLMRADGWRVEFLGASTPVADAVHFAERTGADLLCLSATTERAATALRDGLAALETRPSSVLAIGGAAVSPELAAELGAVYADDDLASAVGGLREQAA